VSDVETLRAALCELEVEPDVVLASPTGEGWLDPDLLGACRRDAACARELEEYVAAEAALCRLSGRSPAGGEALFTARVTEALPGTWIGSRLSPYRRAMLLGAFYAAGALLSWIVLTVVAPGLPVAAVERLHTTLEAAPVPSWMAAAGLGAVALALVAFATRRSHTPIA
jgi:hypothetical protein